jgi:hypothetical protein
MTMRTLVFWAVTYTLTSIQCILRHCILCACVHLSNKSSVSSNLYSLSDYLVWTRRICLFSRMQYIIMWGDNVNLRQPCHLLVTQIYSRAVNKLPLSDVDWVWVLSLQCEQITNTWIRLIQSGFTITMHSELGIISSKSLSSPFFYFWWIFRFLPWLQHIQLRWHQ